MQLPVFVFLKLKAEAARSALMDMELLDKRCFLPLVREVLKTRKILAAGAGYQLKAQAARSESRALQALNPNMISILKNKIFPYITLSNIPLKT